MMIKKIGRTALVTASAAVLAAGGSALFAGTAFAHGDDDCGCHGSSEHHGHHHHGSTHGVKGTGGDGGTGGASNANCLIPVGVSAGVIGQGGDTTQCNANGGSGGDGGSGVSY
jgi:hypothetical protein